MQCSVASLLALAQGFNKKDLTYLFPKFTIIRRKKPAVQNTLIAIPFHRYNVFADTDNPTFRWVMRMPVLHQAIASTTVVAKCSPSPACSEGRARRRGPSGTWGFVTNQNRATVVAKCGSSPACSEGRARRARAERNVGFCNQSEQSHGSGEMRL